MIRTLRLQNFKGIRNVEVGLERLTVFVGPNGSGKTSILQGLDLFGQILSERFTHLNFEIFEKGIRDQFSNKEPIVLMGTTALGDVRLTISPSIELLTYDRKDPSCQHIDVLELENNLLKIETTDSNNIDGSWRLVQSPKETSSSLAFGVINSFTPGPVQLDMEINYFGSLVIDKRINICANLIFLFLHNPEGFAVVTDEFKSFVPNFQNIRLDEDVFNFVTPHDTLDVLEKKYIGLDSIFFDLTNGSVITGRAISEGSLLILGLLAVLANLDQTKPNIFIIDDIDRGLHPLAQRDLIKILRRFLERQSDLQLVATTHSPYLLDSLRPEEVRMTTLDDDGTVACGRLVDHPKFEQWKNEMAPGEMWSMFGEKWVSQSVAKPAETL